MKDKLLSTLGLCRRAGKLVMGFDAVAEAARAGNLSLIVLAEDLSPKSGKELAFQVKDLNIEIRTAPVLMDDIRLRLGKRSGILGVADRGLADTIKTYWNDRSVEEDIGL